MNKTVSDATTTTANAPAPAVPSNLLTVNKYILDEIACDLGSAIELVDAADSLAVACCERPDESNPVHAVLYRAINELQESVEALCALL